MDEKEYEVPEELRRMMDECKAFEQLRDRYIKIPFGFKKAKECATQATRRNRLFWTKFYEIFPETKGKRLAYQPLDGIAKEVDNDG